jgi:hypothetical protein
LLFVVAACSSESSSKPAPPPAAGTGRMVGIYADAWTCDMVASDAELAEALGGTPRAIDGVMETPAGVPRPCNYVVGGGDAGVEAWTFDIDCRDGYEQRAKALFAQYQQGSADLVERYNAITDAGPIKIEDGGAPIRAPGAAHEVDVGKRALDHHGQGLLFIDDNTPCYVRVVGPDATRRLALAKLVAKNLTPARAPMTPRAAAP